MKSGQILPAQRIVYGSTRCIDGIRAASMQDSVQCGAAGERKCRSKQVHRADACENNLGPTWGPQGTQGTQGTQGKAVLCVPWAIGPSAHAQYPYGQKRRHT